MNVLFAPSFARQLKTLERDLLEEVYEKIELFRDQKNHKKLKVHKLSGRLKGRYSFFVNYKIRIVFRYLKTKPKSAYLMAIGGHDIYK
ncbi:MAG: hypothetical protein CMI52_04845 [Parcubacteria group bacterium]|nr:hypothetical protein [Parcubacteria group bacterium]